MAGMDLGGGYGAGNASDMLGRLLAERQAASQWAQQFAELQRSHQADEALRGRQLDEQTKFREMQQASLQNERDVSAAHTVAGSLSAGDSLLQNPGSSTPTVSPTVPLLIRGGQGSNIGVVPPLSASPIPSGASVPSLPSGSDSGASGGTDVLRTGPSMQAPLQQPKPGEIGNVSWLGTPGERKAADAERSQGAYLRTLDPNSPMGQAAMYQSKMGHPAPAFTGKDPAQALQDKKDLAEFTAGLKPEPADHFTFMPKYDENGKQVGVIRGNTKSGELSDAGNQITRPTAGAGQAAQHEAAKKEALGSLDQLDQAIDAAKDLIGPGAGRVSSLEQMVGNADPKIAALGTKMLLTKMQVDHAAAGTVRAGASPQLLARWDNILATKVTPEGLKAAVQAMREIIGGQATQTQTTKPSAADLIKKYGGG